MAALLYLQYALLALTLLLWAVQLWRTQPTYTTRLSMLIAVGLLYDNSVLTLGASVPAGPLLLALNWPRYVLHALVAPLFIPVFADLSRRTGVRLMTARPSRLLVVCATLALVGYGLTGLGALELTPVATGGAVRYAAAVFGPPVIGLAIVIAALAAGAAIWCAGAWPWLAWAALAALLGSGAAAQSPELICLVTNATELLLLATALACERRLRAGRAARVSLAPDGR
jgi:hypothetical protein